MSRQRVWRLVLGLATSSLALGLAGCGGEGADIPTTGGGGTTSTEGANEPEPAPTAAAGDAASPTPSPADASPPPPDGGGAAAECASACGQAGDPACRATCVDACASGKCTGTPFTFADVKQITCGARSDGTPTVSFRTAEKLRFCVGPF